MITWRCAGPPSLLTDQKLKQSSNVPGMQGAKARYSSGLMDRSSGHKPSATPRTSIPTGGTSRDVFM